MNMVLVRPPFYALFGVTTPKMKTYPLNLLSLATYTRERSCHEATVVDGENIAIPGAEPRTPADSDPSVVMHESASRMVQILEDPEHDLWNELEKHILASNPDLVGITCNSGNMDAVRLMVRRLKRHGLPVILGGSHPTALPEQSLLYTGADMVAVGEGELTLVQVLEALSRTRNLSAVPSLVWQENGRIAANPRGDLIPDINALPIPDRTLIDRSDYFGELVMTGRGCPFNCAYCASRNIWGRKVRLRSTESVIGELQVLRQQAEQPAGGSVHQDDSNSLESRWGKGGQSGDPRPGRWVVKVLDDTFTVSRQRTLDILREIVARGLNRFEFTGGVRADTLDHTIVAAMAEANFKRVTLGVESGSPRILKMIRKGETNDDVQRAVELLRGHGIHSHAFFMIGLPDETADDIELSKNLIRRVRPDHVEINMVTPYPGTDIFTKLIPDDPLTIDRWYRWFHQGMATHSDRLGYDLDRAYTDFADFARDYNAQAAEDRDR
jgi:anaerobic magnesium-protoporphyrin IX monomethyl ester cyclase